MRTWVAPRAVSSAFRASVSSSEELNETDELRLVMLGIGRSRRDGKNEPGADEVDAV